MHLVSCSLCSKVTLAAGGVAPLDPPTPDSPRFLPKHVQGEQTWVLNWACPGPGSPWRRRTSCPCSRWPPIHGTHSPVLDMLTHWHLVKNSKLSRLTELFGRDSMSLRTAKKVIFLYIFIFLFASTSYECTDIKTVEDIKHLVHADFSTSWI